MFGTERSFLKVQCSVKRYILSALNCVLGVASPLSTSFYLGPRNRNSEKQYRSAKMSLLTAFYMAFSLRVVQTKPTIEVIVLHTCKWPYPCESTQPTTISAPFILPERPAEIPKPTHPVVFTSTAKWIDLSASFTLQYNL